MGNETTDTINETQEYEKNLALAWHEGYYTDEQAKISAEIQSLDFNNVTIERGYLYEADAKAGCNSWN